jgi:hypothetical protein
MKTKRKTKKNYSEVLNMQYQITGDGILFEDGTYYSNTELQKLHGLKRDHLKKIHFAKKIFKGIIVK